MQSPSVPVLVTGGPSDPPELASDPVRAVPSRCPHATTPMPMLNPLELAPDPVRARCSLPLPACHHPVPKCSPSTRARGVYSACSGCPAGGKGVHARGAGLTSVPSARGELHTR